jgi:alpha-1,2-mannosyltransferase
VAPEEILDKVRTRFAIEVSASDVSLVFFRSRALLEARLYPVFTMFGQSLGSILCAIECMLLLPPDTFIDSMGAAFTYPVASVLAGAVVGCYTHYPTITTEMIGVVESRRAAHNNSGVAASAGGSAVKLLYYRLFAWLYSHCGGFCSVVMANSSWTAGHLQSLWQLPAGHEVQIVYPPCNSEALACVAFEPRRPWVVSIGQFRPEKDHPLQLRAFARLLELIPSHCPWKKDVRLVLVGGARHEDDVVRVAWLKELAGELGISDSVDWRVNAPFSGSKGSLMNALAEGAAGLHCMWNEHFGIGVVELQAAGCVPVAHDSAGPRMDIVVRDERGRRTGCRAWTSEGFARALLAVLTASQDKCARYRPVEECGSPAPEGFDWDASEQEVEEEEIVFKSLQTAGRSHALKFSDVAFKTAFVSCARPLWECVRTKSD